MQIVSNNQDIVFVIDDKEIIKFKINGDIFVKGKLIKNNIELVNALKEFLATGERTYANKN